MTNDKADFTRGSILKKLVAFMMPILGALILQAPTASGPSGGGKIRFHLRSFRSFYRKPGAQPGDFRGDSVCHGYHGSDCPLSRREEAGEDWSRYRRIRRCVHDHLCDSFLGVMVSLARPISVLMQAPRGSVGSYCRLCEDLRKRYLFHCGL